MITITPTLIRNAIVCGIGSLILGKALTTQSAKIFFLTLACLIAAQAIAMTDNDEKKQKDDDDVVAVEEMNVDTDVGGGGGKTKKMQEANAFEEDKEDIAESYEIVEHDPTPVLIDDKKEKKEKDAANMILLKDSFAEGKTKENGTTGDGGATGIATTTADVGIAKGGGNGGSIKSSSKIIADDSPKIIEFVEEYCDDLIDTAVAEVLNNIVSRVVDIGGNQEEEEQQQKQ